MIAYKNDFVPYLVQERLFTNDVDHVSIIYECFDQLDSQTVSALKANPNAQTLINYQINHT